MGTKKDLRKARAQEQAEAKARAESIKRTKKAAKAARRTREKARKAAEGGVRVTDEWSEDPRILLRVGPEFSLATTARDATPGWDSDRAAAERAVATRADLLSELQERLYASARGGAGDSVLLILQGLDTSGKGGIVRRVVGLVDPQGVALAAFKAPTEEERAHDFLWRVRPKLPRPGMIGVFDRSHYEDLLVPTAQRLTGRTDEHGTSWVVPEDELNRRYHDIYEMEVEATRAGTRIIKVCLLVSYEEQGRRLRERLDRPDKHWKFTTNDLDTRDDWAQQQAAYSEVLRRTSTRVAPWYAVPADNKWYSRLAVTEILTRTLAEIDPKWPAATFDVDQARSRLDLTMTPECLLRWSEEKASKVDRWITDDEAVGIAVDALNTASREDVAAQEIRRAAEAATGTPGPADADQGTTDADAAGREATAAPDAGPEPGSSAPAAP